MKRGILVWVNLQDAKPPEMGKLRPAIIVSNEEQNSILQTVVAIPLSTRPPEIWPLRLKLPEMEALKTSYAIIPGIRQVNKNRIVDEIGLVPEIFLQGLEEAYCAYLSD